MDDEVIHLTRRQLREERELQQRRESTRRPGSAGSRRTIGLATLRGPLGIALLWLGGHLAAATLFLTRFGTNPDRWNTLIVGEPVAQFAALTQLARLSFERVMTDVPAPAARLLQALYAVTAGDRGWFLLAVLGLALLADLAVLAMLWRSRSAGPVAAAYWAIGVALLGPVAYARLDLLVVACVVLAWNLAPRRPVWAAVALALGTALAWWPALVLLPLVSLAPAGRRCGRSSGMPSPSLRSSVSARGAAGGTARSHRLRSCGLGGCTSSRSLPCRRWSTLPRHPGGTLRRSSLASLRFEAPGWRRRSPRRRCSSLSRG